MLCLVAVDCHLQLISLHAHDTARWRAQDAAGRAHSCSLMDPMFACLELEPVLHFNTYSRLRVLCEVKLA